MLGFVYSHPHQSFTLLLTPRLNKKHIIFEYQNLTWLREVLMLWDVHGKLSPVVGHEHQTSSLILSHASEWRMESSDHLHCAPSLTFAYSFLSMMAWIIVNQNAWVIPLHSKGCELLGHNLCSLTSTSLQAPNLMDPGFIRTVKTSSSQTLAGQRQGTDIAIELVNCA